MSWIASKIPLFELEATVLTYLIGLLLIFYGYWVTACHQINFLWNTRIHHSSENLILRVVCANRFQVCQSFLLFLLIPAALLGHRQSYSRTYQSIHFFYNFGITKHIKKLVSRKYSGFSSTSPCACSQSRVYGQKPFANIYFFGINFWYFQTN
jgi:sterol desaturase/sphingolipid hydroxylase (fatty acid hydroxylase superfamily)